MRQPNIELEPGEKIEDLQNGFYIIQNPSYFSFGTDAILLSDFAEVKDKERVIDLGTGCGIVPVLLCAKNSSIHVTGIEIQPEMVRMAIKSVDLNRLQNRIRIISGDLKAIDGFVSPGADVVVVNPPYYRDGAGKAGGNAYINIAKREVKCTLSDVVGAASRVLRTGGRFYIVYPTARFAELMELMRAQKLEPKRIRPVAQRQGLSPNFILVEGKKGAGTGVKFLPALVIYEPDGSYTKQAKAIYHIVEEKKCSISSPRR